MDFHKYLTHGVVALGISSGNAMDASMLRCTEYMAGGGMEDFGIRTEDCLCSSGRKGSSEVYGVGEDFSGAEWSLSGISSFSSKETVEYEDSSVKI